MMCDELKCGLVSVQGILRSPQAYGYRNRSDFSIGFDENQNPTCGHLYGLMKDGFTEVGSPVTLPTVSDTAKGYALLMTDFLRSQKSKLPAWRKESTGDVRSWVTSASHLNAALVSRQSKHLSS
jgi:hypothetical protein